MGTTVRGKREVTAEQALDHIKRQVEWLSHKFDPSDIVAEIKLAKAHCEPQNEDIAKSLVELQILNPERTVHLFAEPAIKTFLRSQR